MLPISDAIASGFYFSSILFFLSGILLLGIYKFRWTSDWTSLILWTFAIAVAGLGAWIITHNVFSVAISIGINILLCLLFCRLIPIISLFGLFFFTSMLTPSLYSIIWLNELIQKTFLTVGWDYRLLIWTVGILFSILILINTLLLSWIVLVRYSILYFRFPRLKHALENVNYSNQFTPFVSIHLPCCNEPPSVVIDTLNALANLKYPHFEVIVFDNNTQLPEIWEPIKEHCMQLGERFRFFHVDHLDGAKAGALNACLKLTSPRADLVSVMDSDYLTKDNFLIELVRYFEDPQIGFVQSCQDYRGWKNNPFQTACYYEYETHFKLELTGQNEWDINYTIGTMCLINRKALDEVKGWSEWCLTEDSEVAVRIHALGYKGYYLNNTFGYGLIPETFEGYKQQRFRWSAGPVQQFLKHWRLYLPFRSDGKLTWMQKFGEISHSLATFFSESLNFFINIPILGVCLWFLIAKGESFTLPNVILVMIPLTLLRNIICNWLSIRLLNGSWKDYLLSAMAARSLIFIRNFAFYSAVFSSNLKWIRTDKFKAFSSMQRAFSSSKQEIIGACTHLIFTCLLLPFVNFQHPDVIFLIWLGIANQTISFLCAPIMAYISEKHLKKINKLSQIN